MNAEWTTTIPDHLKVVHYTGDCRTSRPNRVETPSQASTDAGLVRSIYKTYPGFAVETIGRRGQCDEGDKPESVGYHRAKLCVEGRDRVSGLSMRRESGGNEESNKRYADLNSC